MTSELSPSRRRELETAIPIGLINAVRDGNGMLLLGAGASIGALHPSGAKVPQAKDLCHFLHEKFIGGPRLSEQLAEVAEWSIHDHDVVTVQLAIRDLLEPFEPAGFHKCLPRFAFRAIATLNYDRIIEKAYAAVGDKRLIPWISDNDRVLSSRRTPEDFYLLKLHGCISRAESADVPLILSTDQYVNHKEGRVNVYGHFQTVASESPIIAVGSQVSDHDLREVLHWLSTAIKSLPQGYIVRPNMPDVVRRFWQSRGFTPISATFEELIAFLNASQGDTLLNSLRNDEHPDVAGRLTVPFDTLTEETRLALRYDIEHVHSAMPTSQPDILGFYKGFGQGWAPIKAGLDCRRRLVGTIMSDALIEQPRDRSTLYIVTAEAGSGKSVVIRRLAWDAAADLGHLCLFVKNSAALNPGVIVEVAKSTDLRVHLFVDDIADRVGEVQSLLFLARREHVAITIIGAERTNEWNEVANDVVHPIEREFKLFSLNMDEVRSLLDLLKQHRALGVLEGKARAEQEHILYQNARGQLLVGLHEALLGKPFEDIVLDEYESIPSDDARRLYLSICLLNRTGTPVRAGLISRAHGVSFADFHGRFFRPLENLVHASKGHRGHDMEYVTRHPYVAEMVFQQVLHDREKLLDHILFLLHGINTSYESDRASYRHIVSNRTLSGMFDKADHVRAVFDSAIDIYPNDGHAYLHRGIYEMNRQSADLGSAAQYLSEAQRWIGDTKIVRHAHATLSLRRAEQADSQSVREGHRLQAIKQIAAPGRDGPYTDEYSAALYAKVKLHKLQDTIDDRASSAKSLQDAIADVEEVLSRAIQKFPGDAYLYQVEARLQEVLNDFPGTIASLEEANRRNPLNVPIATRLAALYTKAGDKEQALELLRQTLRLKNNDQRLNLRYALLCLNDSSASVEVESCLRRSFAKGDTNYRAQFLYARQLYINEKWEEASAIFRVLRDASVGPLTRRHVSEPITDGTGKRWFEGQITRADYQFCFVRRDAAPGDIFVPGETVTGTPTPSKLCRGDRVRFTVGFNYYGPAVMELVGP